MTHASTATHQTRPDFDKLFEYAVAQQGLFTMRQAAEAGYSKDLVGYHTRTARFVRVQRGIYRLRHFLAGEYEDMVVIWLWSEQKGVFSSRTALSFHDLSDALPSKIYLTVPASWQKRRIDVPKGVVLHYADIPDQDRAWFDVVPVTSPRRTLEDCASQGITLETLGQAVRQALSRGLVSREEIPTALRALEPLAQSMVEA